MKTASPKEISIADLARLFMKHMPQGSDIGLQLMAPAADGKSRMRLPPQPFLSGDPGATFFFPGVLFSMADSACGMAVFQYWFGEGIQAQIVSRRPSAGE